MNTENHFWLLIAHEGKLESHQGGYRDIVQILIDRNPDPDQFTIIYGNYLSLKSFSDGLYYNFDYEDFDLIKGLYQIIKKEPEVENNGSKS